MKLLQEYQAKEKEIYQYFGYQENWTVYPIEDCTKYYWYIDKDGVAFADTEDDLYNEDKGNYYNCEIIKTRQHKTSVFPGAEYTMILVDTHTDGNRFCSIYDNSKLRPCP
jgi:hypothetical protein